MAGLIGWIKSKTVSVLDPDAPARVEKAARDLGEMLVQKGDAFEVMTSLEVVVAFPEEFPKIVARCYEIFVTRAWRDGSIATKERAQLDWIAAKLSLRPSDKSAIEHRCGTVTFVDRFRRAVTDGKLTDSEIATLRQIATAMNSEPSAILLSAIAKEACHLFDLMLGAAMPGGRVVPEAWARLQKTLTGLNVNMTTFRSMVSPRARSIIEAALAEATADDAVTDEEVNRINWLLANLAAEDQAYAQYVVGRVQRVRYLQQVRAGKLPSVKVDYAGMRAGEIVHLLIDSEHVRTRQTKAGPVQDRFPGRLLITDTRLLFINDSVTFDVPHRRVADMRTAGPWVTLQCSGKGAGLYALGSDPELAGLIYDVAVRRGNQTVVQHVNGSPSRHIPRDVRQRVWQTYGGKCADCGATSYLEFDHIVPVAKGGSNGEQNVQLLCRGCNGKKSARI